MALPRVGGHRPAHGGPEGNARRKEGGHALSCPTLERNVPPHALLNSVQGYTIRSPGSQASKLSLRDTTKLACLGLRFADGRPFPACMTTCTTHRGSGNPSLTPTTVAIQFSLALAFKPKCQPAAH